MEISVTSRERGALMIEVLITIAILIVGLMGLLEMQSRLQKSEVESYQRTQALILLDDMVSRLKANNAFASQYDMGTTTYVGAGVTCADPNDITTPTFSDPNDVGEYIAAVDKAEWCLALKGAAEVSTAGSNVGAMVGGRGCVRSIATDYQVTVVWQGATPISAPPGTQITCGQGLYNEPDGSECAELANAEKCRRFVSTRISFADLTP